MPDVYKYQSCKALCPNESKKVFSCFFCGFDWHCRCGSLKNRINSANNNAIVKICAECLSKYEVAIKFPAMISRSNSVSSAKSNSKRPREDDDDSESSEADSEFNELYSQETQMTILKELKSLRKTSTTKHNELLTKIDSLASQISSISASNSKVVVKQV